MAYIISAPNRVFKVTLYFDAERIRARFTNSNQTAVQLIQIESDLQFDPQIKLKAFHQHICGSDQLTHTLTRDQENTGSDWLGKMTSFFIQSESKVGKPKLQQTQ